MPKHQTWVRLSDWVRVDPTDIDAAYMDIDEESIGKYKVSVHTQSGSAWRSKPFDTEELALAFLEEIMEILEKGP